MKKLIFIAIFSALPVVTFAGHAQTVDHIYLDRDTGYEPYESLKPVYRTKCVDTRNAFEAEKARILENRIGMSGPAVQQEISRVSKYYYTTTQPECELVVRQLNAAYEEYLAQIAANKAQDQQQKDFSTQSKIEELQQKVLELQNLLNQLLKIYQMQLTLKTLAV